MKNKYFLIFIFVLSVKASLIKRLEKGQFLKADDILSSPNENYQLKINPNGGKFFYIQVFCYML